MYVSNYGIPNSRLPLRGKRFLADLAVGSGASPDSDLAAAYGGQAAEILLDAISRSDGTRASVTRELRRTRIDNGILGDIRFDRSDLNQGPVTFSVVKGRRFVVDRVIIARSDLVR
jgi:ABC-type branched-subunit amino acid transport system substrate-binding protein